MLLPKIVQVAVEQTAFHFDKPYSYVWPHTLGEPQCGCRVLVPFGGGNRRRQAIVIKCEESECAPDRLKPVISRLDEEPLFTEEMLELAQWMKERTFCTVFEALQTMLPPGLYMKVKPSYALAEPLSEELLEALTDEERQVAQAVASRPDGIERAQLLREIGLQADSPVPEKLLKKGVLVRVEEASRSRGDATVRMVRPVWELGEDVTAYRLSEKQQKVWELLREVGCASVKELCYFCSVTASVVAALQKKGLVVCYDSEVLRSPIAEETPQEPELRPAKLNAEQQAAYDGLAEKLVSGKPAAALLYGVTGSGKTQVYMNLIDETVCRGRQAIVLVPEISLTPQLLSLFIRRYGKRVAVLHSGLSIGERMDEWKRIRRGEACIAVGTRSAVFAPFDKLGLLVMDEEQEHTYKSENAPRYHARDVARFRCTKQGALLLLASATPSVETYRHALSGRYALYTLPSRFGGAELPRVEIVDMRLQPPDGGAISEPLKKEIERCLQTKRQAILLLNRRGYHTFVSCRSCGQVVTCPSCSISMTYHRANAQLMCHYCGHMSEPVRVCPACGSDKIGYTGMGTQRVEEELAELFPQARVLRMDTDTTMSKQAYEKNFGAFGRGEYDIMIGTQMVAKGLDFPRVGLVGVLSADQALYGDDFRCYETTFSLLTQVIGRAGRREADGLALIQTYTPENYVITLAAQQDYARFFETEIAARRMMKYPPYTDLCQFGFTGAKEQEVREAASRFLHILYGLLKGEFAGIPVIALDPSPAAVKRVSGKYRYKLLIKTIANAKARQWIGMALKQFYKQPENKHVTIFADINPATML